MDFKVGDKVVYPNHGVGVIEQVAKRSVGDLESSFYCLRILSTDSTVMVPVDNTQAVGLRKVLTRRETNRVLKALKDGGIRTSAFIGPDQAQIKEAAKLGFDAIEIHTGEYANAARTPTLAVIAMATRAAISHIQR